MLLLLIISNQSGIIAVLQILKMVWSIFLPNSVQNYFSWLSGVIF